MSWRVITPAVLLLVVMVCCGSGGAAGVAGQQSVPKFEWKGINEGEGETVESLGAPSLLKVGSDVFAVAEAQCKKKAGDVSFTGVASQLLTTKTADTPEELFSDALKKTQLLEEGASKDEKKEVDVSRPTTAVKGSDIYMLVGQYISKDCPNSGAGGCGLLLVKGSVNSGDDTSSKKIDWEDTEGSPQRLLDAQLGSWTRLIGSGGSGVKMKDETIVFPVEGTKKAATDDEEVDAKTVSLIIQSKDAADWTLSKGMSDGGCSDPSVVEWEEGKLMMMTACGDGRRRVYESDDKGNTWTEALGTLSRVWGNKKKGEEAKAVRSGFTTATVGNDGKRNVMLVTLPVYAEGVEMEGNEKGKLHLWLTDNTHTVDIGPVSGDDEDVATSSLLYNSGKTDDNDEKLIVLYEKQDIGKPSPGMASVLLTEKLKRVKEVLTTWKKVDEHVSNLCTTLFAGKVTSPDTACTTDVKVTAGLVGFLSGKFSDNVWRDEYLGVNATVKGNGATNTSDGVKFTGRGAGAEWPVGKQGVNQLYHFANYNFTLVATVSIDGEPTKDGRISLMGAKMNDDKNPVLLGLSYDSGGKWQLLCGGGQKKELSSTWEKEKTQHVVLLIRNGTQGSAYVDGKRVGGVQTKLENTEPNEISHFYIGGDGSSAGDAGSEEDVSVTVTNVLLYNRPLSSEEIIALNAKLSIPKQTSLKAVKEVTRSPEVRKPLALETVPQTTLGGDQLTAQQSLKTSEDAGVAGESTTAVSTLTNSPAGKESVNKSTSGTSPDGHQTVVARDGDKAQEDEPQKTPAGNPDTADANTPTTEGEGQDGSTVNHEAGASSGENGETAEDTDGQEEEVNTQDGEVKAAALSSSLGNVPQGNNSDGGTVSGSGLLPSLLLLLGLWVFAAL